jgi:hypothetical protein
MQTMDLASTALAQHILDHASELTLASIRPDGHPHASTASFAHQGMLIYVTIAIDSQKAHNIAQNNRVALTVNAPYELWTEIQGLSIEASATLVTDIYELVLIGDLLLAKYPEYAKIISTPQIRPWPGMLFVRVTPLTLTLLDYTRGFGHSSSFSLEWPPILTNLQEGNVRPLNARPT